MKQNFKEKYYQIWVDVWEFHKRFWNADGNDDYWEEFIKMQNDILLKYDCDKFVNELLLTVVAEVQRVSEEREKNAKRSL
jgi:hypothetical protein